MRLYGKKHLRRSVDRRVAGGTETRDAILWEMDDGNQRCRVKIQGSGELIVAHFPRNWKHYPYWMKIGNAVRVLHRSGVRGYTEVIGEGRAIPTPVEGPVMPPAANPPDMIISGMEISQFQPTAGLGVQISSGTYRIDGQLYIYDAAEGVGSEAMVMDDPPPATMGSGELMSMGTVYSLHSIDPLPPYGYYRYDAFIICADGIIQYLKGVEATTAPVKPMIPGGCLLIDDYIFVRWNMARYTTKDSMIAGTEQVASTDVGAEWTTRKASGIKAMTLQEYYWWYYNGSIYSWEDAVDSYIHHCNCDKGVCGVPPNQYSCCLDYRVTYSRTIMARVLDQYGVTMASPGSSMFSRMHMTHEEIPFTYQVDTPEGEEDRIALLFEDEVVDTGPMGNTGGSLEMGEWGVDTWDRIGYAESLSGVYSFTLQRANIPASVPGWDEGFWVHPQRISFGMMVRDGMTQEETLLENGLYGYMIINYQFRIL